MKNTFSVRNNYRNVAKTIASTHQVLFASIVTNHKNTDISVSGAKIFCHIIM